jgi:hypothetical protein
MIDFVSGKILEVTALVRGASVLGAIVIVAATYYKARTLTALIVAALTAGVFLWTINSIDWWQERVEEETDTMGRTVVVTEVEQPSPGAVVQVL